MWRDRKCNFPKHMAWQSYAIAEFEDFQFEPREPRRRSGKKKNSSWFFGETPEQKSALELALLDNDMCSQKQVEDVQWVLRRGAQVDLTVRGVVQWSLFGPVLRASLREAILRPVARVHRRGSSNSAWAAQAPSAGSCESQRAKSKRRRERETVQASRSDLDPRMVWRMAFEEWLSELSGTSPHFRCTWDRHARSCAWLLGPKPNVSSSVTRRKKRSFFKNSFFFNIFYSLNIVQRKKEKNYIVAYFFLYNSLKIIEQK